MKFFEIERDPAISRRWFVDCIFDADNTDVTRCFVTGEELKYTKGLRAKMGQNGPEVDFSFGGMGVPIIAKSLAETMQLQAPGEIQCFDLEISSSKRPWIALNVLHIVECIDEKRSHIQRNYDKPSWGQKTRRYTSILKLVLDVNRIGQRKIFRPKNWEVVIIVREDIKQRMEDMGVTGIIFSDVT